jgi:ABC-type Fe3+/spermidine/putrescine transport system ATPase subunit
MTAVIALEEVGLSLGGRRILQSVTFSAQRGETLAILGPSGSGKSSALRLVLGLTPPTRGEVQIEGQVVSRAGEVLVPPEERRLAVVFQDLALWPHLNVERQLDFGLVSWGIAGPERRRRIEETLSRLGLQGKERRMPAALSGGERQRVAIARALVLRPLAVLLDEPLASLDLALRREMLETFRALFREQAVTALFVTHDLREAERLGARVIIVEDGRVVAAGMPTEILADPTTPFVRALAADVRNG